jgi:arylsulfatase
MELNGVPQKPIEGISMVYSFDNAKTTERRHTQYFEMFGRRLDRGGTTWASAMGKCW